MSLANDSPSFTPVHHRIRAIGPQDLHLAKGHGLAPTRQKIVDLPEKIQGGVLIDQNFGK